MVSPPRHDEHDGHDAGASASRRKFQADWVAALRRTDAGRPTLRVDFVAQQGRAIRLVDVRPGPELVGELGHVPGTDWVPAEDAAALAARVGPDEPLVLVSTHGFEASRLAGELEAAGLRAVAAMEGGMRAWNELGFSPSRTEAPLARRGELSPLLDLSEVAAGPIDRADVQNHLGDPTSVRWLRVASLLLGRPFSCVDGRDHCGVIGTPGGDAGELALLLGAIERVTGAPLSAATIDELFRRRLDAFGRFGMHTDTHAGNRSIAALRADPRTSALVAGLDTPLAWRAFFARPPEAAREALLEIIVAGANHGCGHLRLMSEHPAAYGVREGLVYDMLRAAFMRRWRGATEVEITPLPGGHGEGAVLNVRGSEPVEAYARVPLVAPSVRGKQVFVNHPEVAAYFRRQLALWASQQGDLAPLRALEADDLAAEMASLHGKQLVVTLGRLAAGLPVFDVLVRRDGSVQVEEAGRVSAAASP